MTLRDRVIVGVWLIVLAIGGWIFAFHTEITADLTGFLPKSATPAEQLLVQQLKDGVASRLLLVGIEGAPEDELARVSKAFAPALKKSGLFSYVGNGEEAISPEERELLIRSRYLLSPAVTSEHFTAPALRDALDARLAELASPMGFMTKEFLPRDPTGEFLRVAQSWAGQTGPAVRQGVWFSSDGKRALLVIETRAPGFDAVAQQQVIDSIRGIFASVQPKSAQLLLSGTGVFSAQSKAIIEKDSWQLSTAATVLVMIILFVVYRSGRVVALGMLPVVTGLVVGVVAVGLSFGTVHGITLGFGATLIGEAVDYPSYLFTHVAPGETVRQTLLRIWPTLRLAVLTTVFGAIAMLLSSFTGLAQLGLLSLSGVFAAGVVTRWVLPALAPQQFGARKLQGLPNGVSDAVRGARRFKLAAWVVLVAGVAVIAAKHDRVWDDDLGNMSPVSESAKALDQELRAELGAPDMRYLVVVNGESQESVLRRAEVTSAQLDALVQKNVIAGFDSANRYLPSLQAQEARKSALPENSELRAAMKQALKGSPFKPTTFEPFIAEVAATKSGAPLQASDFGESALGLKLRSLLSGSGDHWVALMPLTGVHDDAALAAVFPGTGDLFLLDMKSESNRMVNSYRNESLRLAGLGVVVIAMVLWFGLKEARAVARVLAPVLIAVVATVAALLLLGARLSLFHIVSLLLVIGIGLNYALFFNRHEPDPEARRRTELSLAVCSLATLSAFGALAMSQTSVLHAIGLTVSLGALFSLLISMVLAAAPVEKTSSPVR